MNDITQLNPILVNEVVTPTTVEEVQAAVKSTKGKISIGGGRYSMGGQTATENGLQIDMRKMNKVLNIDDTNKKITVQAGIRWRDIQDAVDPHNLSVKIMQTYSNFTVGGSLSVNVHGRYIGQGPLIRSVDSIKLVLADGSVVTASPQSNSDLFYAAIGGYGGIGVIVEATLHLADNVKVERQVKKIPASEYKQYFFSEIRDNKKVIFHNGDIYPPEFKEVSAVSWLETDKPLTITDRMIPRNQKYSFQPGAISAMTSMPFGRKVREDVVDPLLYRNEMVVWRNHEASYDVAELEPASREHSTFVLQEYFVPVEKFDEFIPKMRDVFKKHDVEVFNVSIRHALPDTGSLLAWAQQEVFAFVVYYRQGTRPEDREEVGRWTREMISEVLSVGGRYYLPYQIQATDDQFHRAYPRYQEYFDMKKKVDPEYRFTNKLWDRYYVSLPDKISSEIKNLKDYSRREEQTFLGLPEWYIVFNADEYAAFLKNNKPSEFNYFKSAGEFWNLKNQVTEIIKNKYPSNSGYEVMLWVIGSSYSIELWIKGVYESTVGRLT
ncbi:MAG: FAD-binding oxidoreductase, partial [Pseudobdellovibrio sp.]